MIILNARTGQSSSNSMRSQPFLPFKFYFTFQFLLHWEVMRKSYGLTTPFVGSPLIYDLNKIMSLFIKLKASAKRYPLEINIKNRKIIISFYRQSSLVSRLKEHYVYYFALGDCNLFYVRSLKFPPKGKSKSDGSNGFLFCGFFPTITLMSLIIYFHAAYAGNFNSIQNGHVSVITYVICKFHD